MLATFQALNSNRWLVAGYHITQSKYIIFPPLQKVLLDSLDRSEIQVPQKPYFLETTAVNSWVYVYIYI